LAALDGAAKRLTVEAKHALEVDDTQDDVVDFANKEHGVCVEGG
jgi:hypothetical protein